MCFYKELLRSFTDKIKNRINEDVPRAAESLHKVNNISMESNVGVKIRWYQ